MNENYKFVVESNLIEGITREPTPAELSEHERFMGLDKVTIKELERFVGVYQPNAVLRDKIGLNVRVGSYYPPQGGIGIRNTLNNLLDICEKVGAYETHLAYESLHPFTDGNGRSGRQLWAWQTQDLSLGFLHRFYYQTLNEMRP